LGVTDRGRGGEAPWFDPRDKPRPVPNFVPFAFVHRTFSYYRGRLVINSGIVQMLRDRPEFGSLPPHALAVLAWCYSYSPEEYTPTRKDIMRAMTTIVARMR
jgi:hypothetical protein